MTIQKQVTYWTESSKEDWRVAQLLLDDKAILHSMFFVHLTLEKALKANVCKYARDYAPYTHDLLALARIADIPLSEKQEELLFEINTYNIRGRYPDMAVEKPTLKDAREILKEAKVLYEWLIKRL